jgi:hypothetical protein
VLIVTKGICEWTGDKNGVAIKILHVQDHQSRELTVLNSISQTHLAMGTLGAWQRHMEPHRGLENNTVKGKYFHTNRLPHVLLKHTLDFSDLLPSCVCNIGPALNSKSPSLLSASTMLNILMGSLWRAHAAFIAEQRMSCISVNDTVVCEHERGELCFHQNFLMEPVRRTNSATKPLLRTQSVTNQPTNQSNIWGRVPHNKLTGPNDQPKSKAVWNVL